MRQGGRVAAGGVPTAGGSGDPGRREVAEGAIGVQPLGSLIWLALFFALLWLLMIRPQRERERRRQEMLGRLRPGDRVVTIGGFHGEVVAVDGDVIRLRLAPNVEVDFQKAGVAAIREPDRPQEDGAGPQG